MVGSKVFMSPEILDGSTHSFPCDMWSLGIILFMMLSGSYPFDLKNTEYEIKNTPVIFYEGEWGQISWLAKGLI